MTMTPEHKTAEQIVADLIPLDLIHDRNRPGHPKNVFEAAKRIVDALRAAGLLMEENTGLNN